MNKTTALAKLRKLLGDKLAYRENPKAPTPEQRAEAKEQLPQLVFKRDRTKAARTARYEALIVGDAEYQRLKAEAKTASDALDRAQGMQHHYRIEVGTSTTGAGLSLFTVKAEGDNWQQVVDKLYNDHEARSKA